MLYPPEQGTWGGGTRSIVVTDSSYYLNRWFADDAFGQLGHHFTSLESNGQNYAVTDTVHSITQWIAIAGLTQTNTKAFIDITSIQNYNPTSQQYSVVKYDPLGHLIFNNVDTNLYPYIYIKQTLSLPSGDIISVGDISLSTTNPHAQNVLLIKCDSLGNQIWKKKYGIGSWAEKGECIALCADGGFIIGGAEVVYDGPDVFYKPIIIKTDSNGNAQWKRKFGSTEYSNWPAYGITTTQDGGYAFCGGVGVNDNSNVDQQLPWVVKLNSNGIIIWADTNTGDNLPSAHINTDLKDIIELADGSLVVCGNQYVWYENKPTTDKHRIRGIIKKYSPLGIPLWARYHYHPEMKDNSGSSHMLYDIDPTPDGGYVAAGYATFTVDNVQSTWVIKVDSFGCLEPGCEVNSVPKIQASIATLKIYPNPASEILNIEITPTANQQEYSFELYDILGKRVLTKTLQPNQNTINIQQLPAGVYTYKIGTIWGQVVIE